MSEESERVAQCPMCLGEGEIAEPWVDQDGPTEVQIACPNCKGHGVVPLPERELAITKDGLELISTIADMLQKLWYAADDTEQDNTYE